MELENRETWNYKKIQRKVNKIVRKLNKQIEDDELWKGRFYIRQVKRYMKPFDDMSGVDDAFLFEMYDKKTGMKHLSNRWYSYFALKTFNKPIHLILGGLNRNQDYHELDEYITHVKYIYAIGEVTDSVFEYAKSMNIPCYKGYTLDEAMRFLKQNIKSGEVVLLSPGASSQDQYLHFEDRGTEFKNIVEKY